MSCSLKHDISPREFGQPTAPTAGITAPTFPEEHINHHGEGKH